MEKRAPATVNVRLGVETYRRLQETTVTSEEGIPFRNASDKLARLLNVYEKVVRQAR